MEKQYLILTNTGTHYQIRQETFEGKQYMVVPVIMMREGVHAGSHGPLFHSAEELGRVLGAWDGMPITIGHPKDGQDNYVSANSPQMLEQCIGRVFNTQMEGDKLKAEAWIDKEKIQRLSPLAAAYIMQQKPLDVSVGVFTVEDPVSGTWNDEQYTAIATQHRPDHLALLPGEVGACSWEDGCGIRTNQKHQSNEMKEEEIKQLKDSVYSYLKGLSDVVVNVQGYVEKLDKIRSLLDSMDDEETMYFAEEVFDSYMVYQKRSRQAPQSILFRREYQINSEGNVEFTSEPVRVRKEVDFVTVNEGGKKMERVKFNTKKKNMEGKVVCLEAKVDALIANKATKFTVEDRDWLMEQDENTLAKLEPVVNKEPEKPRTPQVNAEQVINEFKDSLKNVDDYIALAPKELQDQLKTGLRLHQQQRDKVIKEIIANSVKDTWTEGELKEMDTAMLEKIHKAIPRQADYSGQGGSAKLPTVNKGEMLYPTGVDIEE